MSTFDINVYRSLPNGCVRSDNSMLSVLEPMISNLVNQGCRFARYRRT